jgi:two-component system sensor histidine kinase CiaH
MAVFKKKLALITSIYWVLLLYIIAALVWWFISLENQNNEMTQLRLNQKLPDDPGYTQLVEDALDLQRRKHAQYVGEGAIFMLLIVVGALFVYRATRRQWIVSQQQHNFMLAITHELKTPISVVRLNLETMRKRKLDPAIQERLITNTLKESDRLNDLCNNILLASRLEGGKYQYHNESCLFNEIVDQSVAQFRSRFPDREINFGSNQTIELVGDPLLLKLLINNLLENALKYAPKESPIDVVLNAGPKGSTITVADFGPGIPDDQKELVFEKFYRMGNENTRSAKGTGLGLYLCKKIAKHHGGEISIASNHPQGSIFTVVFRKR